ncbi:MAG: L-rhamnose mutarotase [Gemmatimonadota bacterium]|nr:L-rhamnose mutarotase [Gemmatimonadota bacterium]
MPRRYCFALDLKDDPALIAEYERHHRRVWPEITRSIRAAGIADMEIYRTGTRLFMIMEVEDRFSFEAKAAADAADAKVQEWETLMSAFQQALPWARPGEKWVPMSRIFTLEPG